MGIAKRMILWENKNRGQQFMVVNNDFLRGFMDFLASYKWWMSVYFSSQYQAPERQKALGMLHLETLSSLSEGKAVLCIQGPSPAQHRAIPLTITDIGEKSTFTHAHFPSTIQIYISCN